jgi:VIT1/CCC1 family predicted Fe2+/Mn2+ transporter
MTTAQLETSLSNLKLERDAIALYESLARIERDQRRASAFRSIAENERRHAEIWATKLREAGVTVPPLSGPRMRVRFIVLIARVFGTRAVSDLVRSLEGDEEDVYNDQSSPEVAAIAADEREHAEIWKRLDANEEPLVTPPSATSAANAGAAAPTRTSPAAVPGPHGAEASAEDPPGTGRDERWHTAGRTGTLRAAIFGISDGLVSNLALVMGVVGANPDNRIVILAGVAGLLAGAFSMGAGEWISMQSQRELFERQIAMEREELRVMPEQEEQELARIYRRKGLSVTDSRRIASRLMEDPEVALDTKVREELGLDPDELGSPWGAAIGSFVAFSVGAFVPLAPFLVSTSPAAFVAALVLSGAALFIVGAGVSLLTGRSAVFSGARQVLIGAAAAAVTFAVGNLIGVQIA